MRILITGGAGNIGATLANKLAGEYKCEVAVVDNLLSGSVQKLNPELSNLNFIKCDVNIYSEINPVMTSGSFDYVFHYAAVVGVERTLANPMAVLKDIEGIKNILSLSKNTGVKRVFYSSSSEVYGESVHFPQNEDSTPLNSRLPYAVVKNVGESFFKSYYSDYGLNYTIFRFFNTYGPLQSEDFVFSRFLKLALENHPISVFGDGLQSRTFCYIDDNLDFVIKCLMENRLINDVVNVGNDEEITIKDLAEMIINSTGSSSEIEFLPPLSEGDMTRRLPDISRMKEVLGRDLISCEEGIIKTMTFWKKQ